MQIRLNYETHIHPNHQSWLVFLHGAGGSIQTWKYQKSVFAPHFNLLLIDLRDHGLSIGLQPSFSQYTFEVIRNDIRVVLDELNIVKAHFVTLSFGSVLLQDFQNHFPHRVDKVVVAGGIFDCNWLTKVMVHLARIFNVFLPYSAMYRLFSYLLMPYKRNQLARKVYQQQAEIITQLAYMKWLGLYAEFFKLLKNFSTQSLSNEVLVVMGSDDYVFLNSAKRFVTNQPKAKLKILPKVGHICNIEAPHDFNELALDFLTNQK
jgi:pimeloyl-ACP methyl ester carboxylesterase